eukprot:350066-Chlamydomonas_euryale.AAC.4
MIFFWNIVSFSPKPASLIVVVGSGFVWVTYAVFVPYYTPHINYMMCGNWAAIIYVQLLYTVLAFSPQRTDLGECTHVRMCMRAHSVCLSGS